MRKTSLYLATLAASVALSYGSVNSDSNPFIKYISPQDTIMETIMRAPNELELTTSQSDLSSTSTDEQDISPYYVLIGMGVVIIGGLAWA